MSGHVFLEGGYLLSDIRCFVHAAPLLVAVEEIAISVDHVRVGLAEEPLAHGQGTQKHVLRFGILELILVHLCQPNTKG